jgi:hypothetical protein
MADDNTSLSEAEKQELLTYAKMLEQSGYGAGYPVPENDKSMTGFFREIASTLKKTFRAGNLDKDDDLILVRGYLDTSHYANCMGMDGVGQFLEEEALILSDTSLGKGGFLIRAAITTRKDSVVKVGEESSKKKKSGFFGFGGSKKEEESSGGL